jgi:hypothetical protein
MVSTWRDLSMVMEAKAMAVAVAEDGPFERAITEVYADRRFFNQKARNRAKARVQTASRRANRRAA